jgi:hypothetical protein
MDTAHKIREAVAEVELLRRENRAVPELGASVGAVKRFQARRFAGTYADLLASPAYSSAARFFLDELYSDKDYAERDAQFARIAGAVEKFFPADVAQTAVALARLHSLTESLDHAMALAILERDGPGEVSPAGYVAAWRAVGRRPERDRQLVAVLGIGDEMARLTRLPGLRFMLKMMRGPAAAAGLTSLQRFLEAGFDTFSGMARRPRGAETFLAIIREREARLLAGWFDADPVACETELAATLGQAR